MLLWRESGGKASSFAESWIWRTKTSRHPAGCCEEGRKGEVGLHVPLLAARILKGVKLVFLILLQPQWAFRGTMAFSLHFVVFCLEACLKHSETLKSKCWLQDECSHNKL